MSDVPAGLETLHFTYHCSQTVGAFAPVLVGVVGSGNLEVMLEAVDGSTCDVQVDTSARGFGAIWQAVMDDFHARHPLGGVRISINDMGATPAVVSLRLDQAIAELKGGQP
ncbi:MAG: malonate decarboxylase acyl carrier protein [Proteobacteria bacterium]|nr:malonate decarboxylase acyl carrier protein [Pseudomonadota bacterium]